MSLILEALRRSEAERRRGEAPDVLAPVEVARPVSAPGMPARARWGAVAVAVIVVAGAAWWQLAPTGAKAPTPTPTSDDLVSAPASTPAPALPPPAAPAISAAPSPSAAVAAPPPPAAPVLASTSPPAERAPTPTTDVGPDAIASAPPLPSPADAPPPPSPAAVPAHGTEFISPEATVRLAELTSEERNQLPALKISMHMWAPDPANRFVIIDGARLEEGDRVADATVSAILADGVTLAWRGRQIRLPIR